MLRRSSSPPVDLEIMVTRQDVEGDIRPILEHCPRLLYLLYLHAPDPYLERSTIEKLTYGEWAPNIEELRCRIHHHLVDAFLDMLETKWEGNRTTGARSSTDVKRETPCQRPASVHIGVPFQAYK